MDLIPHGPGDAGTQWLLFVVVSVVLNIITLSVMVCTCLCKCIHFGNREVFIYMGEKCPDAKLYVSRKGRKFHANPKCHGLIQATDVQGITVCKYCFKGKIE